MRVVATAGHVDHGKSSLVLALTGTDPDRFPEEKARGLTIDLGFAFATLPSGAEVGFVDVPGHVRFIKNMLAGVGAVDVVLFVVAANEGWMLQSEEHLRILEVLGVGHGVVALTKADAVDGDTLELARLELDESLAGSPLADAPVVVCDAVTGRGLDELRSALDDVLATAPPPVDRGRPRLWVDRAFTVKGAGTVVTGTLVGGAVSVGDEVTVGSTGRRARVRTIESAHHEVTRVAPGVRVALNLAGVELDDVGRGDAVLGGDWMQAAAYDVALRLLPDASLRRRSRVQCYAGSGEHAGILRLVEGDTRFARLELAGPVPLVPGDRVVLRDTGRRRTLGGAEILAVAPGDKPDDAAARLALPLGPRLLATHPWVRVDALGPLTGLSAADAAALADELVADGAAVAIARWLVHPYELMRARADTATLVETDHAKRPHAAGVELAALAGRVGLEPDQLRAALDGADDLVVDRGVVRHASHHDRQAGTPEAARVIEALAAEPFAPPDPAGLGADPNLVRALVREGALVDLDGVVFAAGALAEARSRVESRLGQHGSVTVADVRDLLGSTRKYVVPILTWLDREGVTRRRGDDRVPGPARGRE